MGLRTELGIHRPGRTAFSRAVRRVAASRPGSWVFARILPLTDRPALRLTGGRVTVTDGMAGFPTLFLTTTGAKSGQARTVPLGAVPFGEDGLAVIGSNWGQAAHPGWVHNLARNPRCTASYGSAAVQVLARELHGDEAEQVWATGRELYHGFRVYPERAGARQIRVFALEPAGP